MDGDSSSPGSRGRGGSIFGRFIDLISRARRRLGWSRAPVPRTRYPDDIYLVSYPKSGSTWLRFLIGSYIHGPLDRLDDLARLVPDLVRDRPIPDDLPRPRFLKSHAPVKATYPRVVYLLRDGRDVAVSLYHHARREDLVSVNCDFPTFLDLLAAGRVVSPGRWGDHVTGWLERSSWDLLVVRFEDMKRAAPAELVRVLEFAGIEAVPERVERAVQASRFERMQRLEAEAKWGNEKNRDEPEEEDRFIRKGKVGEWRDWFTADTLRQFERRNRGGFVAGGYPLHSGIGA